MTKPIKLLHELVIFHLGVNLGIFEYEKLIQFCDHVIQKEENPNYFFIEQSIEGNHIYSFINPNIEKIESKKLLAIVNLLFTQKTINTTECIWLLYKVMYEYDLDDENENMIYYLDTELYILEETKNNKYMKELSAELQQFLNNFKDQSIQLQFIN